MISSWYLKQRIWKNMLVKLHHFLLGIGVKLKNIWNQHLENHLRKKFEYMDYLFLFPVVEKGIKVYVILCIVCLKM